MAKSWWSPDPAAWVARCTAEDLKPARAKPRKGSIPSCPTKHSMFWLIGQNTPYLVVSGSPIAVEPFLVRRKVLRTSHALKRIPVVI